MVQYKASTGRLLVGTHQKVDRMKGSFDEPSLCVLDMYHSVWILVVMSTTRDGKNIT